MADKWIARILNSNFGNMLITNFQKIYTQTFWTKDTLKITVTVLWVEATSTLAGFNSSILVELRVRTLMTCQNSMTFHDFFHDLLKYSMTKVKLLPSGSSVKTIIYSTEMNLIFGLAS